MNTKQDASQNSQENFDQKKQIVNKFTEKKTQFEFEIFFEKFPKLTKYIDYEEYCNKNKQERELEKKDKEKRKLDKKNRKNAEIRPEFHYNGSLFFYSILMQMIIGFMILNEFDPERLFYYRENLIQLFSIKPNQMYKGRGKL